MSNKMIISTISAVLLLGVQGVSEAHVSEETKAMMQTNPQGLERCFGIAKKGMNDCGSYTHNCSGEAKIDGDKKEWLFVPTGLCKRIVGGSTIPPKSE
jgi:uncharacterized membrane protein